VRLKWFGTAAAAAALVVAAAAPASASSQPPKVISEWKAADAVFAKANEKWSAVIEQSNPSLSALQKAGATFAPAISAFNSALQKINFTGKAAADVSAVVTLQKQEVSIVRGIKSIKSFEASFGPLVPKFVALQTALGKDLGIPAAEIII